MIEVVNCLGSLPERNCPVPVESTSQRSGQGSAKPTPPRSAAALRREHRRALTVRTSSEEQGNPFSFLPLVLSAKSDVMVGK
jgi:hypothetical protein